MISGRTTVPLSQMWVPLGYSHLQQPNKRQLNVASEHHVDFQENQWKQINRGQKHQLFSVLKNCRNVSG